MIESKETSFEKILGKLNNNSTLAILGARLSTIALNVTAALNPVGEVGSKNILKGAASIMRDPKKLDAFHKVLESPAMQARLKEGGNFALQQVKESTGYAGSGFLDRPTFTKMNRLAQKGVAPIGFVDSYANTLTLAMAYQSAYDSQVKKHGKEFAEAYAMQKVETVIFRTAQPTIQNSLSLMEIQNKSNVLAALMIRFMSEPRKTGALAYESGRKLVTGKGRGTKAQAAERIAVYWLIYGASEILMRSLVEELTKEDDEDRGLSKLKNWESWASSMALGPLRTAPLIGEGLDAALRSGLGEKVYNNSPNPLLRAASEGFSSTDKILNDDLTVSQTIDEVIDIVQADLGLIVPVAAQAANVAEAAKGIFENPMGLHLSDGDRVLDKVESYRHLNEKLTGTTGEERYQTQADFIELHLEGFTEEMKADFMEKAKISQAVSTKLEE